MEEDAFDSSVVSGVSLNDVWSWFSLRLGLKPPLTARPKREVCTKSLPLLKAVDILRITSDKPPPVPERADEFVGGCGGLDIVANLLTETRDEHVKY